ncbi:MAG: insulinase family protein [Planctomycetes bacterium]|nr:insulinase family protein [Planctomycetota bacterium]
MPYQFRQATLPNGLTIIAEIEPSAHSAAAGFFVKSGARDESTEVMGVSHFLEHMMFKGTADMTAAELNQRFDEIGARNNAFTSNEITCFYAHVLPDAIRPCVDLLGRMMRPALNQSDFDTEKGVILEEIAMYKDNPFWVLYEACTEKHFGSHPLSHRVLGTNETITALQRDQMLAYFQSRYSADNTVVALAGRLDFEACVDQIAGLCGSWQSTRVGRDNRKPPTPGGHLDLTDPKITRGYVLAMCDAPPIADTRRYAAALLGQIFGAPDNSRLHWSLLETGLAEEAQASFDPHDGYGDFFVYASGEPERVGEIWETIQKELDGLRDSLTQGDIDRLLNKFVTGTTIGAERPHDRMHRLGRLWAYLGEYTPLEEELDRISRVTLKDLREVHEAFGFQPVTTGRLLPGEATSEGSPQTD